MKKGGDPTIAAFFIAFFNLRNDGRFAHASIFAWRFSELELSMSSIRNDQRQLFRSPSEIEHLRIIDFNRLHGYWRSKEAALDHFFSLFGRGGADYAVYDVPSFDRAPEYLPWRGWKHAGDHPRIGRLLWNWFHQNFPDYDLVLSDQPDFQAIRYNVKPHHTIWGDIGLVSPQAFGWALTNTRPGDVWISILDGGFRHVVITILTQYVSKIPKPRQKSRVL